MSFCMKNKKIYIYIDEDMKELNKRDKDTIDFSYLWTMLVQV